MTRRTRSGAIAIACALALSGCAELDSALSPAGPQAARIARLWWPMLWLSCFVLAAVTVVMLAALARQRRRTRTASGWLSLSRADEPGQIVPPAAERGVVTIVGTATALTTLILLVLLTLSVTTGRAISSLGATDAVTVELVGSRWWWEVRYPDPTPSNLVVTANEIHVPVGRPVRVRTIARDVIHSFWTPNLQGKRDLIPGHPSEIWIQADREGHFPGQCAEFCGHQHAHMRFVVVAESPDRFAQWLEDQRRPASPPSDDRERRGQTVFLTSQCALCHTIRGTAAGGRSGPDLTHFASRLTIGAGTLPNTPGHLAGWIIDPQGVKPGVLMPANAFPSADLQALLAYVGSLR